MDEKTAALRDIFLDLTDEATVTEHQEESHGSLATDGAVDDRLRAIVAEMRERFEFHTSLDDDQLVTVVHGFYEGESDTGIARRLGDESLSKTVSRARFDLHLLRDRDLDAPFDLDRLRELLAGDRSLASIADELDVSESTVRRYRRAIEVRSEIRTVGDRYREEFETVLTDRALQDRLTDAVRDDGLGEATEGMETNLSF